MKMFVPLLCLIGVLATSLSAQATMSPEDFDAYTKGKTLYFGRSGKPYGAERYLENRRVIWSFLDGECKDGYWYPVENNICFIYEDNPIPQCWTFRESPKGLVAQFESETPQTELYEAQDLNDDLMCLGPQIGV